MSVNINNYIIPQTWKSQNAYKKPLGYIHAY